MAATASPVAAVVDLESLPTLDRLPGDVARVATTFQISPARQAALTARWPAAEFVAAVPTHDGPWQPQVEADLAGLARLDVALSGVPFLDVFRAVWREELALLHALQYALRGARAAVAIAGTPSAAALLSVRERGGLEALDLVPAPDVSSRRPRGILRRLREAGPRGIALALSARLDPSHARRSRLRLRPRLGPARAVLVSSYVNPTRAALQALAHLGGGPAVLVRTGPGATTGLDLPSDLRVLSLSACASLAREDAARLRGDAARAVAAALDVWDANGGAWAPWGSIRGTSFGRALLRVLVPEVATAVAALRAVIAATGASTLVVGDEFSFPERAALHLARALGVRSVSRQHGVLDAHYLRDTILADEHLAWDDATVDWLRARGATVGRTLRAVPLPPGSADARAPRRDRGTTVVVFLQPTDLERVPLLDWIAETIPPVVRAAAAAGARVVVKPHPLQTAAEIVRLLPPDVREAVTTAADRSAASLLPDAIAAVTLDSSVAVDCRRAGVPCFSTGWWDGAYAADLEALGYVTRCASPAALEAAIAGATAASLGGARR